MRQLWLQPICFIVTNHPFIDANKRVGAMAAYVFLDINGFELSASEDDFEVLVWRVARGEITKEQLTEFFGCHVASRK